MSGANLSLTASASPCDERQVQLLELFPPAGAAAGADWGAGAEAEAPGFALDLLPDSGSS